MSTTADAPSPESPAQVLAGLRDAQSRVDAAEVDKLHLAVAWADMHSADSVLPGTGFERVVHLAGVGAPGVAEFAVGELAAVLGVSTDAGSDLLGEALEIRHRLPLLWAAVGAGRVRVWRARQVARATRTLCPAAAAYVDAQVAWVAGGVGPAALARVVEAALAHHDPDALARHQARAAERRSFDIDLRGTGPGGTTEISGVLDLADARDLEDAITRRAGLLGTTESLDVRRSVAVGDLARQDLTLDLSTDDVAAPAPAPGVRPVLVHVHLSDAGVGGVARVERGRHVVSSAQVQAWCRAPGAAVTITPVVDLAGAEHVEAYEVPDRMRTQVVLRDLTCVFPWCTRPSRGADLDHVEPWQPDEPGGPGTSPPNLAPLCRHHHRLNTHTAWTYRRTGPTTYEWTSPHGHTISVHRGTTTPT